MSKLIIICLVVLGLIAGWFFLARDKNQAVIADLEPRAASEEEVKIIAFGDSLTAGYGLSASETYPAQLEDALVREGYSVTVINAGVSGETTRGNLERAAFIRNQNPEVVLLGIGGNDALRLLPFTETKNNLTKTIETLQSGENPPVIILLQMQAPLTAGLGYKRDFDAMYEELADTYGLLLSQFLTTELFFDNANKLSDGIHYNEKGYQEVVTRYLMPVVTEVLDQLMPE